MATIAEERKFMGAFYGEMQCMEEPEFLSKEEALESVEEAIYLYSHFLNSAIERNDQTEMALCRRELQEAKCEKRRLLAS